MKTPQHTPATSINREFARKPLAYLVSSLTLVSCLAATQALAQQAPAPASSTAVSSDDVQIIDVIGTRQAEQNAIDRKKHAKTAMDSIVAEDVGKMPDQNVGEAISRIAGVALDRGDVGEGVGITIRGNSPDLTRVELDGQAVQSGGGASGPMNGDLSQGGSGRAQGMRDLPADLIKSVDVIKGSTAEMTEGSLGGGVQIKTRSSLDFKKRYTSLRVSATEGSINKDINPNFNFIMADQFLDGRLGVMVNASKSKLSNEAHSISMTDNSKGYTHDIDFDGSPEKTFSFNPDTVSKVDALATTPIATYALTAGGNMDFDTPLSFVTKAGAAQTKADCYAAFPALTDAQVGALVPGKAAGGIGANVTAAKNQRSYELVSCLNQWNDWTPTNMRYFVKRDYEDRNSADLRVDFKVNDDLVVYLKGSRSTRDVDNSTQNISMGGLLSINPATNVVPGYSGATYKDDLVNGVRTAIAGSGYYTTPNNVSVLNNYYPLQNTVTNVIPGSVEVDANHHVTSYSYSNGAAVIDNIMSEISTTSQYLQFGGTFERDNLLVEFMAGDATSEFHRKDLRSSIRTYYGEGTMSALSNGQWTYTLPDDGIDLSDPTIYGQLNPTPQAAQAAVVASINGPATPAYTSAQRPLVGYYGSPMQMIALYINDTEEQTAKVDVTYKFDDIPFITRVKGGLNYRKATQEGWGPGGYTVDAGSGTFGQPGFVAPIIVPNNSLRGSISACEDTAGSLAAGGQACQYGYTPFTALASTLGGNVVLHQQELQDMIAASMEAPSASFMNSLPGRDSSLINGWQQFNTKKFFSLAGVPNLNFDCIKECMANDGNVYKQPVSEISEQTFNAFLMADFEINDLPFGMNIDGNFGVRTVQTDVYASGLATFTSTVKNAAFDPINPTAAAGVTTSSVQSQVSIDRSTTDVLPSFNLGLWALPDQLVLRYSRGITVARPNVRQMLPAATCIFDERTLDSELSSDGTDADQRCTGTFGNPSLKAQRNLNQNLSLEWYPEKGYMLSAAVFRQESKVGPTRIQTFSNVHVFEGSDAVDPITGNKLSDYEYTLNTYTNGPGIDRKGVELSGKAALTFLPWKFKYLGVDFNTSTLQSSDSSTVRDLNSGDTLPPYGESAYAYNFALWYDDGHLTARIAYQSRGETFVNLTGTTGSSAYLLDYPADGVTAPRFPYNIGGPNFKDKTSFIDAKISYKFDSGLDIYLEGRNLGLDTTTSSSGGYYDFESGAPALNDMVYYGRKITAGVNYKF